MSKLGAVTNTSSLSLTTILGMSMFTLCKGNLKLFESLKNS